MAHDANDPQSPILDVAPLGFPWVTMDPFLFCVHHLDHYPSGNARHGIDPEGLAGRNIGMDFEGKDGWRMYHGDAVPGFPAHPHRGFETVTLVRRGRIDHADSMGAAARFGDGDCQWMTAGQGVVHSEMFPLLKHDEDNPLELFQIWLNLPAADKMVEPHFAMLWSEDIPKLDFTDDEGRAARVAVVAGQLGEHRAPAPPPRSWASRADSEVCILTIRLAPGARWTVPASKAGVNRTLYVFEGGPVEIAGRPIPEGKAVLVDPEADIPLVGSESGSELLMLQGRPIGEPVAQHGPFVMNDRAELMQAFMDYQRTRFGGWPWDRDDPVHGDDPARFAKHADGRRETPPER